MAHLIMPVSIASVAYCPICQSGRATKGVLTYDYAVGNTATIDNDCSPWTNFYGVEDEYGEISIGIACGNRVDLKFRLDPVGTASGNYSVDIAVYVDGVAFGATGCAFTYPTDTFDEISSYVVTIPDFEVGETGGGPCGSIITVVVVGNPGTLECALTTTVNGVSSV